MTSAHCTTQIEPHKQIGYLKADYALQTTIFWVPSGKEVTTIVVLDTGSMGENANFIDLRFLLDDLGLSSEDVNSSAAAEFTTLTSGKRTLGTVKPKIYPVFSDQKIGRPKRVTFHVLEEPIFGDALLGRDYCKDVYSNGLETLFLAKGKSKLTDGTPPHEFALPFRGQRVLSCDTEQLRLNEEVQREIDRLRIMLANRRDHPPTDPTAVLTAPSPEAGRTVHDAGTRDLRLDRPN